MHHPSSNSAHTFFIPVMGIGFTVDSPLRVAKYGISSTISLVDDTFIEQMRKFHCERVGEHYEEISRRSEDHRARRITAYLNLVDRLVKIGFEELKESAFEPGSDITRYFELLPDCPLKSSYLEMLATTDAAEMGRKQEALRRQVLPGSIDVNIMTKLDRDYFRKGKTLPHEFSDALAALRGYAESTLSSSIVFSAGLNPRLYSYAASFDDFLPDKAGLLKKQIVLKVSDYRSAVIQGKFLAKRGLWISEYRIESGLNCGGHAFPSRGNLMGPILDEFKQKKEELIGQLHKLYTASLASRGLSPPPNHHEVRFRVSGGVGTSEEHDFLRKFYGISKVGWGTPFLLVPEVTNVDDEHVEKLINATEKDVYLSASSPMNVPFWNLRTSASEDARRARISGGDPGSHCPKGHAKIFNTEFTTRPDCISSRTYQSRKLAHLREEGLSDEQLNWIKKDVLAKSCICHDLSGGATLKNGIDPEATPAICCGPAIVNFSKIATLEEMVGHIYGRLSLLTRSDRPHMFIRELSLNLDFLKGEMEKFSLGVINAAPKYFREFKDNLGTGVEYYRKLAEQFVDEKRTRFLDDLGKQVEILEKLAGRIAREPKLNTAG